MLKHLSLFKKRKSADVVGLRLTDVRLQPQFQPILLKEKTLDAKQAFAQAGACEVSTQ